jgi:CBS domain-containing protein
MPTELEKLLMRLPGCARLDTDALATLAAASRVEEWPAGAGLIAEGAPAPDWYGVVESGAVQVSHVAGAPAPARELLGPGDVLDPGTPGLPAPCSASAVEATRAVLVPQALVARRRGALAYELAAAHRGEIALFVRRVRDLVTGSPVTCSAGATLAEAAQLMTERRVGSVIVLDASGGVAGILTDRDLRTRVVAPGLSPGTPVGRVMSSPVVAVEPGALAFDAVLEMMRRGIRHLAVIADGRLLGVVSSHDLVLVQAAHPVGLAREIGGESSPEGLAALAARIVSVVRWLASSGAGAVDIGRLVAELNDQLVRRALALVLSTIEAAGHGPPPLPFAWLAAGSEGRREQTLRTDQDNGLVYLDPPAELEGAAAKYFERVATAMAEMLARLGFPPCPGGFMASNPRWRQPQAVWRRYFRAWMETPQGETLLQASLFFDLRPIAGTEEIGHALWEWVCEQAPSQTLFLRHMAKTALERHVPLGFFGGFMVERSGAHKDRLDLKARGVFPITQAVRVHALSLGVRETNTVSRLQAAGTRGVFSAAEVAEIADAYEVVARVRLTHQLACLEAGLEPDNFIDPRVLGKSDRLLLKEAFRSIAWLQRHLEDRYQTALVT